MQIMYYVVYGFLWLVSLLPLRVLYILSDGIYALVYYVFKYRRDIVMNNLLIAFPEKTDAERKKIAKEFYHNLIDTFIETIKMISASPKWIARRCSGNWEVFQRLHATGRSAQLHLGHNFNWEWANVAVAREARYQLLAVYMPIASKPIDRLFIKLRSKAGSRLLRATKMSEDFIPYRKQQYLLGLVADQNPGSPANAYWFNFFGRPAPFVKGPARNAINNKTAVVFAFIHKTRRGRYEIVFQEVLEDASGANPEELTKAFVGYLEGVIRANPSMWLWSHRRWKWEWKEEYGPVLEV